MKLNGVVKGKTIELDTDPKLPEGQPVLVELEIPTAELHARVCRQNNLVHIMAARSWQAARYEAVRLA